MELDFTVHWCPDHLEPFRAHWPKGAGIAMIGLFDAAARDERIVAQAGGNADLLHAVMGEFAPLCCFIDPGELSRVYAEAGIDPD